MRGIAKTMLVLFCGICVACAGGGNSDISEAEVTLLCKAVPSDALAVVCSRRAVDAISYFDSTSALHGILLGEFADSRAVLSLSCYTSLVPVLTIDTGPSDQDPVPGMQILIDSAHNKGYQTAVRDLDDAGGRGVRALVICPSETVLSAVLRHIDEGASIVDVPLFPEAFAAANGSSSCVIARCSAAARLLPPSFMAERYPRTDVVAFASALASWIVLSKKPGGACVIPVSECSGRNFCDFISTLPPSSCQVGRILPERTEFLLDFPISEVESFRSALESYRDARISLESYRAKLQDLKNASGKNPLDWERNLNVKEVAVAVTDSARVLLVRPERVPKVDGVQRNSCRGFVSALYGRAFDAPDDCFAACDKWLVFGTEEDVRQFTSAVREGIQTEKRCKMVCRTPRWTLSCTESGNSVEFLNKGFARL